MAKVGRVRWSGMPERTAPELRAEGGAFQLADNPFGTTIPYNVSDTTPFEYRAEGKYLRLTPIGVGVDGKVKKVIKNKAGALSANKRIAEYLDAYDIGLDLHVEVSQSHWKKIIRFGDPAVLSFLSPNAQTVTLHFLLDTDYDLPDGVYGNVGKRKIGDEVYFEQPKAWDSGGKRLIQTGTEDDPDDPDYGKHSYEYKDNVLPVEIEIYTQGNKRYLVKRIPVSWLQSAVFPIFTDVDLTWGSAVQFTSASTSVNRNIDMDFVDTDLFVLGFSDGGATWDAIVGSISSGAITFGTMSELCSAVDLGYGGGWGGIATVTTTRIAGAYPDDDKQDDGFCMSAPLTGSPARAIGSWGTETEYETGDVEGVSAVGLASDIVLVVNNYESGQDDWWTYAIDSWATTPTVQDEGEASSSKHVKSTLRKLNATHAICIGIAVGGNAFVAEYTGGTLSFGAISEVFPSASYDPASVDVAVLSETNVVFVATDRDSNNYIARAATINLTTHAITLGDTVYVLHNPSGAPNAESIAACRAGDGTHFLTAFRDVDDTKGYSIYSSVEFATGDMVITSGTPELFNDGATGTNDDSNNIHKLLFLQDMGTYCICGYCDDADANDIGEARVGTYPAAAQTIEPSPVARASSVQPPSVSGSGIAPITITVIAAPSAVQAPSLSGIGDAPITLSAVVVVSSVQAPSLAATGAASIPPSPVSVVTSVIAPTIVGSGIAPISPSAVAVVSSVQAPSVAGSGEVLITPSPVQVVASVVAPTVDFTLQEVTFSSVAVVSSVQTPSVSGDGTAEITASYIQVTSTVSAPSIAPSGFAPISPSPVGVSASVVAPVIGGQGTAEIAVSPIQVVSSVPSPIAETYFTVIPSPILAVTSVQSPSVAGVGTAEVVLTAVAIVASIQAPAAGTRQDAEPASISVSTSVVAPSITAIGAAPITPSPIQTSATVQTPAVAGTGTADITVTPIAAPAIVQSPSISGVGIVAIMVSPVSAVSAVAAPTVKTTLLILLTAISATSSVKSPTVSGSGIVSITLVAMATVASVVSPEMYVLGRILTLMLYCKPYYDMQVYTKPQFDMQVYTKPQYDMNVTIGGDP